MSIIRKVLLVVEIILSLLYLIIITIILPRISKQGQRLKQGPSRFPKEPIICILGFYLISTGILIFIFKLNKSLTIIINLLILAVGRWMGVKLRLIGITGQICSGKSDLINYLTYYYNSKVITSEEIENIIFNEKKVTLHLIRKYGNSVLDSHNKINKTSLIQLIHEKPKLTISLDLLTKLKVIKFILVTILKEKIFHQKKFVFLEFDFLFQVKTLYLICYPVLSVCNTDKELAINRIMQKSHANREKATFLYYNQITLNQFNIYSENVIYNEGSFDEFHLKIDNFMAESFLCEKI